MPKLLDLVKKLYQILNTKNSNDMLNKLLFANESINQFFDEEIDIESTDTKNNSDEKIIWQLWLQGEEKAPPIIQKCFSSVKRHCKDYQINVLDLNSIKNYIEIPDFIWKKYQEKKISNTHFSDYVRTCLLAKYGGVWLDSTVYLTDSIPQEILNQDFFIFKSPLWLHYGKVPTENLFNAFLKIDRSAGCCGSNWFIVSKKNNEIIQKQKKLLEKYWKIENKTIHYFLYHLLLSKLLIKTKSCAEIYNNMLSICNKEPHLLQNNLHQKYDEDLFNEIKKLSSIHKLTYKKDNIIKDSFLEFLINNN